MDKLAQSACHASPEPQAPQVSTNHGWTTIQEATPDETPERGYHSNSESTVDSRPPSDQLLSEPMDVSETDVLPMMPDQPMLYQLRVAPDTLTKHRIGKECAAQTNVIQWASGIQTVLPPAANASSFCTVR